MNIWEQQYKVQEAGEFFRSVLTDVLDDLRDQVPGYYGEAFKIMEVQQAVRSISQVYRTRLSTPTTRSDWNDAANRCAYVFLYLMQHCNLVFSSLQSNVSEISAGWLNKDNLKVCSIGGGPGSDLLGLTTFLRLNGMRPSKLRCLVLDLYPDWKNTWDKIHACIPWGFKVAYQKCDVVRDTAVPTGVRCFIQEADMLTLVKSFSAMAAFFRASHESGDFLRDILRELKPGCFLLYIDNDNGGDNQFQREFASRAGFEMLYESCGIKTVPSGAYPYTIGKYSRLLDFSPMRSCNVKVQLFRKRRSAIPSLNVLKYHDPPLRFSSATRPTVFRESRQATTRPQSHAAPRPPRGHSPPRPNPFSITLIAGILAVIGAIVWKVLNLTSD